MWLENSSTLTMMMVVHHCAAAAAVLLDAQVLEALCTHLKMTSGLTVVTRSRSLLAGSRQLFGQRSLRVVVRDVAEWTADESYVVDLSSISWHEVEDVPNMGELGGSAPSIFVVTSSYPARTTLRINQKVYFLRLDSGVLSERYTVGGVLVERQLASE